MRPAPAPAPAPDLGATASAGARFQCDCGKSEVGNHACKNEAIECREQCIQRYHSVLCYRAQAALQDCCTRDWMDCQKITRSRRFKDEVAFEYHIFVTGFENGGLFEAIAFVKKAAEAECRYRLLVAQQRHNCAPCRDGSSSFCDMERRGVKEYCACRAIVLPILIPVPGRRPPIGFLGWFGGATCRGSQEGELICGPCR